MKRSFTDMRTMSGAILVGMTSFSVVAPPSAHAEDLAWGRIAAEGGMSLLGATAGAATGSLIGLLAVGTGSGHNGDDWSWMTGVMIGALAGGFLGLSYGTFAGGELAGGDGHFGWTLLGSTGGLALGAGLIWGAAEAGMKPNAGLWFLGVGLPLVGGILGYELTEGGSVTVGPGSVSVRF